RDQGAGRMTLAWQNGDTSASLMYQQYNENSHRSRKGDYICTTSPTPDRGCILGGTGKDMPNPAGTYDGMIGAFLLGIAPPGGDYQRYIDLGLLSGNAIRPTGMNRQQTHSDFEPIWETDAETVIFEIAHQLDAGELSLSYSTYDSKYKSRADTDMTVGPRIGRTNTTTGLVEVNPTAQVIMYDLVNGGDRGVGGPTIAEENFGGSPTLKTGIYQDNYILQSGNRTTFINGNVGEAQNRYAEAKFVSDFDGPHNFILGANYMEQESIDRFLTASSPLTMLAGAASYYLPTFGPSEEFSMQALGVFGEYYYQINDDMKLTVGARWADETKDRDTIDASYFTAVDYAGAPYSSAAFNVGGALRSGADAIATGQAFLIDAALHSSVVNFALLESTTASIKTNLSSGNANASAYSASGAEAIAREEARTGADYTTAINAATKNYVVGFNAVVDGLAGNDAARELAGGGLYIGGLANATTGATGAQVFAAMSETQKVAYDRLFAKSANLASYVALVKAAGAVPSMQAVDSGYLNPTWPSYLQDKFDYETVAGRVVFDWQYNDNSMMYVSYARGVKPGGINASVNPRTFKPCSAGVWGVAGPADTCVDVPPQTEEEVADTFEIGVKTDLMDGQLRLNATAFFTDYTDLQIASTINASEFNFNSDAEITGAELELTYLPEAFPNLRVDFMANFLDTEITSNESKLNPFNKLAIGTPEDMSATHTMVSCTVIIFDGTDACIGTRFIVKKTDLAAELAAGTYTNGNHATKAAHEMWVDDLGTLSSASNSATITAYPTYGDRNYYDATSTTAAMGSMGIETSSGATVSIEGNSLPQAPEESFNLAFSYTHSMSNGTTLIPTASLYYQSEMFNSEFNSTLSDQIDSWEEVNLGLTVIPAQGDWVARVYVRNATDEDNVTTKFNSTDITGNYQTWQYRDPRTVGLELTMDF
ncbi:MAG: TonB-dependent receptor domain-containing protein, partial [Gammaproteobacteria bacterium]